jgi:hypothetical protein
MSGKPFVLTALSVQQGCARTPSNLAAKLCNPLYAVVQAILTLANPLGSSEFEILSQVPTLCTDGSVGPAQVTAALAQGVAKRVLKARTQANLELRYLVNLDMNKFLENEDIYNDFRAQLWCGAACAPCPTCVPHPPCELSQLVPKTGALSNC